MKFQNLRTICEDRDELQIMVITLLKMKTHIYKYKLTFLSSVPCKITTVIPF